MSLPSGYKRLEYIQSSGTQYIDTGFVPDSNTRVTADFQLISPGTGNRCVFGTAGQFSFRWYGTSSKWRTVGKATVDFAAGISGTARYTVDKTATLTKLSTGQTATTVAADSITLSLYIFAQHAITTEGVNSQASMMLWSCCIYSGETLARDFIPCKNASGVIGLWDDVNSQFYANAGTGVFTAGPEVAGTHKARINATDCEIKGGTCTIDATAYKIKKGRTRIDATGYDISLESGTPLSEIPVGNTVKIAVNGTMRDWIVVNQGIPSGNQMYDDSCNGTWLLMKDIYESRQWNEAEKNNYAASSIHSYLNGTFLNLFESGINSIIQQVKIPYVNGTGGSAVNSGANGLSCKIFLPSAYEIIGYATDYDGFPLDGDKLSFFEGGEATSAIAQRVAYINGNRTSWWTRSAYDYNSKETWIVTTTGNFGANSVSSLSGVRPAMILPSDTRVADDGTVLG